MTKKYDNGILRDCTPEEEADLKARNDTWDNGDGLKAFLRSLRFDRDDFLKQSDWTQYNDSPLSDDKKNEWKTYRQSLRDLTNGLDTIEKVKVKLEIEDGTYKNFPTKPGA